MDLWVQATWIPLLEKGEKWLEVRLARHPYLAIRPGHVLWINRRFSKKVVAVRQYPTFEKMLEHEPHKGIAPHHASPRATLAILRKVYRDDDKKFGVLIIELAH